MAKKTLRQELEAAYAAGPVVKNRKTGKVDRKGTKRLRRKGDVSMEATLNQQDRELGREPRATNEYYRDEARDAGVTEKGIASAERAGTKAGKIGMRRARKEGAAIARKTFRDTDKTDRKPKRRKPKRTY